MELDAARWSRLEVLYERALARPADDRRAFLESSCGDDPMLCAEILAMLADTERPLNIERLVVDDEDHLEPPDALLGVTLGPWRLVKVLGRGGSGTVYLVERADGHYEQRAALKLMAPRLLTREAIERFRIERRILARLVHPNIARLIDGGFTAEGTPYLVMEFVDGMALTAYCDEHRLTVDERLRLFRVVCGAVQHAHRALVVHRDLKPSNIYVSSAGEVKLLDFGIAKLLEPDALGLNAAVTRTEHRVLTPAYAAPEQIRGEAVTTATDVYGLGVVLFEILTAARPFSVDALGFRR
jgi:eukaryotic-like serine/threonine-protein kinase